MTDIDIDFHGEKMIVLQEAQKSIHFNALKLLNGLQVAIRLS